MTKLDAIQQKIDAATKALADANARLTPLANAEGDALGAYLKAQEDEGRYTAARMDAEIKYRQAQAAHSAGKTAVDAATKEIARWQAAWEKTLEE